eukprot:TRINITY_DN63450_c0_g1_i1.p1 TRINITY_DN63450_c0_g1~~TRINITY_DN63450_c0_g1_i1.p1  ORF type:complete len:501 (+),score=40.08 TRINITY_DN63450_c0_g1_i1:28-1530(+)
MEAGASITFVCYAFAILAGVVSPCLSISPMVWVVRTCRCFTAFLHRLYDGRGNKSQHQVVKSRFQDKRARLRKLFAHAVCLILSVWNVQSWLNILKDSKRWMTFEQDVLILVVSFAVPLWITCNPLRKALWEDFVVVVTMIFLTLGMLPFAVHVEVWCSIVAVSRVWRAFCCACLLDVRKAVLWNGVYIVGLCWSFVSFRTELPETTTLDVIIQEVAFMGAMVAIVVICIRMATSQIVRQLDVEQSEVKHSATHALLNTLCDVVIELDEDLKIAEPASKLATMLFLNERRSLQGAEFKSHICTQADQARFEQALSFQSNEGPSFAAVFNTTMRDSNSSRMTVELIAVPFHSPCGGKRRLVGIREVSDMQPITLPSHDPSVIEAPGVIPSNLLDGSSSDFGAKLSACSSSSNSSRKSNASIRRTRRLASKETSMNAITDLSSILKSFGSAPCETDSCPQADSHCQESGILSSRVFESDRCDMRDQVQDDHGDELSRRALSL